MTHQASLPPIVATDGTEVSVRYLTPADGDRLIDLVLKLSPNSRYFRFHASLDNVSRAVLERDIESLRNVDGINRVAVVATVNEEDQEAIIGVARMARGPDTQEAEIAVVVRDDWQRKGVGSGLMLRLAATARDLGITQFWAVVLPNNRAALTLFSNLNVPTHLQFDHGEAFARIDLEDIPA